MCSSPRVPRRRAVWCAHTKIDYCSRADTRITTRPQVTWVPGVIPDSPDYQYQADISPARRKRGERSSGGNRIHSGSRHYHEDGNHTDDAGRRWNLKKDFASKLFHALCRVALITLTTPHH